MDSSKRGFVTPRESCHILGKSSSSLSTVPLITFLLLRLKTPAAAERINDRPHGRIVRRRNDTGEQDGSRIHYYRIPDIFLALDNDGYFWISVLKLLLPPKILNIFAFLLKGINMVVFQNFLRWCNTLYQAQELIYSDFQLVSSFSCRSRWACDGKHDRDWSLAQNGNFFLDPHVFQFTVRPIGYSTDHWTSR